MAEYIEREALIEKIDAAINCEGLGFVVGQTMKRYIKRHPAADVAPVRRGEWVEDKKGRFHCSECSVLAYCYEDDSYDLIQELTNFCPNCGADMNEKPHREE